MADGDLHEVEWNLSETKPSLPDTDDDRSLISSFSNASSSSSLAQAAKLKRILSEKKLEQLRRAKARKLKEEMFKVARGYLLERRFPFLKLLFGRKASTDFSNFWYSK